MKIFLILLIINCIIIVFGNDPKKIIGGNRISINEFPWIVAIGTPDFEVCSGSILSNIYILTSAHCLVEEYNVVETTVQVLTGTSDLLGRRNGIIHQVAMIYYHEQYKGSKIFKFDICILELEEPMVFSSLRQPINLPTNGDIISGETIETAGWGVSSTFSNHYSRHLNKISMNITTFEKCLLNYPDEIDETVFCAEKTGGGGIGKGDSGSPVVYDNKIIGIVDSGNDVDDGQSPSIFTKVYVYIDWINKIMKNDN